MIVYTGGSFEVLHIGHILFLKDCAKLGKVIVSLNTDDFIKSYKGHQPIYSYSERKKFLQSLDFIFDVVENEGSADSKIMIDKLQPDIIAIGSDWADKDYYKQMGFSQEWLDKRNIILVYIPYRKRDNPIISVTEIKKRIASVK